MLENDLNPRLGFMYKAGMLFLLITSFYYLVSNYAKIFAYGGCGGDSSYYAGGCRSGKEITDIMNAKNSGVIDDLKEVYDGNLSNTTTTDYLRDRMRNKREIADIECSYNNGGSGCYETTIIANKAYEEYMQSVGSEIGNMKVKDVIQINDNLNNENHSYYLPVEINNENRNQYLPIIRNGEERRQYLPIISNGQENKQYFPVIDK